MIALWFCVVYIRTLLPNYCSSATGVFLLCYHFVCIMCYFRLSTFHLNFTIIIFYLNIEFSIFCKHFKYMPVRLLFLYQSIPFSFYVKQFALSQKTELHKN